MKKVLVYSADSGLSYNSYILMAVCDTKQIAINLIMPELVKYSIENFTSEGYDSSKQLIGDLIHSLNDISQTQSMDTNYVIKEIEANKLF